MRRGQEVDSNMQQADPLSQYIKAMTESTTKCPGSLSPVSAFNVVLSESSKKFNTYKFKILRGGKERSQGGNKS